VIGAFPEDRSSLKRLAEVIYEQGRYEESLEFSRRMLAIDPEDRDAWYWALQCYKDLGRDEEAAQAEAAFDRFRPDDRMEPRAARFRLADPYLQRMEQPIHVHFQPGMSESDP
jgi:tetratricopeptide (TPR) repeat protein